MNAKTAINAKAALSRFPARPLTVEVLRRLGNNTSLYYFPDAVLPSVKTAISRFPARPLTVEVLRRKNGIT